MCSLKNQTYENIEIVFVAERSKDLFEKIKNYANAEGMTNVKVIFNNGEQGASAARNLGIVNSAGQIIAIIDDDTLPFPEWAAEIIDTYNNDDSIIGVTGPCRPLWENKTMNWFPEEFHWVISCTSWCNWDRIVDVRNVWLENASFKRQAFEIGGLLDTQLGPQDSVAGFKGRELAKGTVSEEVELSQRIKKKTSKRIVYNPEVKVWHRVYANRLQWSYIVKWSFWLGLSKKKTKSNSEKINDEQQLAQEYDLLSRIFTRLLPRLPKQFIVEPISALRKLFVTIVILDSVFLGYFTGSFNY